MTEEMRPLTKKESRLWKWYVRGMKDGYDISWGRPRTTSKFVIFWMSLFAKKKYKEYVLGDFEGRSVAKGIESYKSYSQREALNSEKYFRPDELIDYTYHHPAEDCNSEVYRRRWLYNKVYKEGMK